MDYEKEIPFGAFDSELMHQEIFIPEGFEATIDGNKIILTRTESEDERIREGLLKAISVILGNNKLFGTDVTKEEALAWLEKQKQHTPMQNGVIINGVEYELIKDNEEDECERCALHELCNNMAACLCNALYSSQVSVCRRFEKR